MAHATLNSRRDFRLGLTERTLFSGEVSLPYMQLVFRRRALRDPARERGRERADGAQRRVRRVRVAVRVRER